MCLRTALGFARQAHARSSRPRGRRAERSRARSRPLARSLRSPRRASPGPRLGPSLWSASVSSQCCQSGLSVERVAQVRRGGQRSDVVVETSVSRRWTVACQSALAATRLGRRHAPSGSSSCRTNDGAGTAIWSCRSSRIGATCGRVVRSSAASRHTSVAGPEPARPAIGVRRTAADGEARDRAEADATAWPAGRVWPSSLAWATCLPSTQSPSTPTNPLSGLVVGERPEPEVPDGWTTITVKAASLNHHDLFSLRGVGLKQEQLPMILGTDAAGLDEDGNEVVVHGVISDAVVERRRDLRPEAVAALRAPPGCDGRAGRRTAPQRRAQARVAVLRRGGLPADRLAHGLPDALHARRAQAR